MVFMCQRDSYLKEFTTKVKACTKTSRSMNSKSKKEKIEGLVFT